MSKFKALCKRLSCCCADVMVTVMMGVKIKVSVCVSGLSININSDGSISSRDQSVEKGALFITLELDCKRNVPVNINSI